MSTLTTNTHVVTAAEFENGQKQMWDAMKSYVDTQVDSFGGIKNVRARLQEATERYDDDATNIFMADLCAINKTNIKTILEELGADVDNIAPEDYPIYLRMYLNSSGVFIMCTDGTRWTSEDWNYYVEQHGERPGAPYGILFVTQTTSLIMCINTNPTFPWATYGQTVPMLNGYSGGFPGSPKSGYLNTLRILGYANPGVLKTSIGVDPNIIEYVPTDGPSQCIGKYAIFFSTLDEINAMIAACDPVELANIQLTTPYFIYPATETTWNVRYLNGTVLATISSGKPAPDTQGMSGSAANEYAWLYKVETHADPTFVDPRQWWMPSVVEIGIIFMNKAKAAACLTAIGATALSSSNHWSSLQTTNNGAYYVELGAGSVNSDYYTSLKNTNCVVRAVTKL